MCKLEHQGSTAPVAGCCKGASAPVFQPPLLPRLAEPLFPECVAALQVLAKPLLAAWDAALHTVSSIRADLRYGLAFAAGRRSSRSPYPWAATCSGMRTEVLRSATPARSHRLLWLLYHRLRQLPMGLSTGGIVDG
jgi:hypothetical protein